VVAGSVAVAVAVDESDIAGLLSGGRL